MLKAAMVFWLALGLVRCSGDSNSLDGPDLAALRAEVVAEGSAAVVRVDSVRWIPQFWGPTGTDELEITGVYRIWFRNTGDQPAAIRYDLRFFDRDEFLIDVFIPFGLPLQLAAQARSEESGEFSIRTADPRAVAELRLMRITMRID